MSILEQLFSSAVLDLAIPDSSLEYPPGDIDADDWLAGLSSAEASRKQAFFDEELRFFLILRIEHQWEDIPVDVDRPPAELVTFIAHLQVSLEATYISSTPTPNSEVIHSARISTPPRTTSFGRIGTHDSLHPSIYPPTTPNPTPSTADDDRVYSRSEGTLLMARIWGQNVSDRSLEAFSLLWSQKEKVWAAVYRLGTTVSFLRLNISNPLLCLTVSSTLRDKPLAVTGNRHPLASFLAVHGVSEISGIPPPPPDKGPRAQDEESDDPSGLEEVNLLEGLGCGPTFATSGPDRVHVPTTRLGGVTRRRLFSLPPVLPRFTQATSPAPSTARITHATLRKSFRKTLQTFSGFRVRMRTVFVPYVLLPSASGETEPDDEEYEREKRQSGNDEHTVVLCVEIENSGESGLRVGFAVEGVDVKIGGEGAKATLIDWKEGVAQDSNTSLFPLLINSTEQYNLLYAVSFMRAPGDIDGFSLTSNPGAANMELQRAVTISILGKPFLFSDGLSISEAHNLIAEQQIEEAVSSRTVSLPTQTFCSRWNCVLDLSSHQATVSGAELEIEGDDAGTYQNALPEPPSPFPLFSPRTASTVGFNPGFPPTPSAPALAGTRRPTFPETPFSRWSGRSSTPTASRQSTIFPGRSSPSAASKLGVTIPAIHHPTIPTTYMPPTAASFDHDEAGTPSTAGFDVHVKPPTTPAYPAYTPHSTLPPTPASLAPAVAHQGGSLVGPSVEIRRERGTTIGGVPVPQTPGPTVSNTVDDRGLVRYLRGVDASGPVVVSIGLLPLPVGPGRSLPDEIFPLDQFSLDIFVYNQSKRTRNFEVSCPHRRRRRQEKGNKKPKGVSVVGILPLNDRVQIGPLLSGTCQSVRMQFLALVPGVHTVDVMTLTDVQSGNTVNLRSVLDVVVHER